MLLPKVLCFLFSRPDMSIREQNQLLLDSTCLQLPCEDHEHDDDEHLEGPPLSLQRRIEASNYLLEIDNDRWCSDQIVHWCKFGCCGSVKESKLKLWVALQDRIGLFLFHCLQLSISSRSISNLSQCSMLP